MATSPLGRIAINIAPVIAHLIAQGTPLVRRHALTAVRPAGGGARLAALALLPAALYLITPMGLTLCAPLIQIAATRATAPARTRLRPRRLRGSENSQSDDDGEPFHDVQLTLRYTES